MWLSREEVARAVLEELRVGNFLEPGDLAELLERGEHRICRRRTVITAQCTGEWAMGVLARGELRSYLASPSGGELTLKYLRSSGGVFRLGAVDDGGDEFAVQTLADGTELYVLDCPVLLAYLTTRPVAVAVLLLLLEKGREAEMALSDQALHTAPERVWRVLRRCTRINEDSLVEHTLEELAGMAGVTVSEASRSVTALHRQGVVQRRGHGRIEVRGSRPLAANPSGPA